MLHPLRRDFRDRRSGAFNRRDSSGQDSREPFKSRQRVAITESSGRCSPEEMDREGSRERLADSSWTRARDASNRGCRFAEAKAEMRSLSSSLSRNGERNWTTLLLRCIKSEAIRCSEKKGRIK